MKLSELPAEVQQQLAQQRAELSGKRINTAYRVELYNADGTRYFEAARRRLWIDDKGNYVLFGGRHVWTIRYGAVQWAVRKDPLGGKAYELCNGKQYGKSVNGTEIPKSLNTKKEVLALVKSIGIFTLK
jgi:hypothetical protein